MADELRERTFTAVKSMAYHAGYDGAVGISLGRKGKAEDSWTSKERKEIRASFERGKVARQEQAMAAQGSIIAAPATSGEMERIYGDHPDGKYGQVIAHVHEHKKGHHTEPCSSADRHALETHYHVGDRAHRGRFG